MEIYKSRLEQFQLELKKIQQKHTRLSLLRLATFIAIALSWFWLFTVVPSLGATLGSILLVVFFILLKWHKRVEEQRDFIAKMVRINELELKSTQGDFQHFDAGNEFINHGHAYSYDMDLFGIGSLFQFLNRTVTEQGKSKLAFWLEKTPLENALIANHQQAIQELAPQLDFRQKFQANGQTEHTDVTDNQFIKQWLELPSFFGNRLFTIVYLTGIPFLNIALTLATISGYLPASTLIYLILVNLGLIGSRIKSFNQVYVFLNKSHNSLKKMLLLLTQLEALETQSELTTELKNNLYKNRLPASSQIHKLTKLLDALDNRNNLIVGILLNSFLLWDWNLLFRIEKWQLSHQLDYEHWQETLGYFDTLNSLANFSYNNPEYSFPKLSDKIFEFQTENLGHPLLDAKTRICNDFSLEESARYAIVTGANMAGKSTFLRTAATNLVLAGCGAPVCATKFAFTPLPLFSSMRTEDSLMKNESYFFAELKRLQQITRTLELGNKMFIILDEILRGTNSEDKRKGSIGFVKKITQQQAYGLVATHDLELARLAEQQPEVFKALCFEVTIDQNKLQFDYKLQPGVTQNMNASFLMKQMGIID